MIKFRASEVGKLIAAKDELTLTAKKYLAEMHFYNKTGRKALLENKYLDKGIEVESKSRDLLSEYFGKKFTEDFEGKENDYVTGHRDVYDTEAIYEIKSSYSFSTFAGSKVDSLNTIYLYQVLSYLDLWQLEKGYLCYCLVDSPISTLEDELKRLDWKHQVFSNEMEALSNSKEKRLRIEQVVYNHIFTLEGLMAFIKSNTFGNLDFLLENFIEISKEDRVNVIEIDYDQKLIDKRNSFIEKSRNFLNQL